MNRLLVAALLLLACKAHAAPFLVSDPAPQSPGDTLTCVYQIGSGAAVSTPLAVYPPTQTGPGCVIDLAPFAAGSATLQLWYHSSLWGVDSAKVGFTVAKPAAGGPGPTNLRIAP